MWSSLNNKVFHFTPQVDNYCWLKSYSLYYGFVLPILIIIVGNMVMFAYVTRNICRIVSLNKDDKKMSQVEDFYENLFSSNCCQECFKFPVVDHNLETSRS